MFSVKKSFKTVFSLNRDEATTNGDSVEFQGDTIEGTAMPLQYNGAWKDMIEPNENNEELVEKFLEKIFETE